MRGAKVLVEAANFQLHPGQKVGLTGANGAGKSSVFAMLRQELPAEKGDLTIPPHWVIAHVAQETPALTLSAIEFVLDGDAELSQLSLALTEAETQGHGQRIAELHMRFDDIEGYSAKSRAGALMHGLGFTQDDIHKPVHTFSGGWRVRLNLARALMCRSDLLLLDEPTNHLDLDAVIWLEGWLKNYRGTLLLISHDREFLDAIVDHIAHIEQQQLRLYRGGYSDFERQRAETLALQQAMFERQQRKVAHLHSYIDRFKVQATKARQAQSRIKALERMEMISAAHVDSPFAFQFRPPISAPEPLLAISHAAAGYAQTALLSEINLSLRPGERIGLLGRNGAGKSTLIKLIAGELSLLAGQRVLGKDLKIGYFAQHQLEQLRAEESPLQHLQRLDRDAREQALLDFLGGFDFRGEMAKTPCLNFSGGEKSRLALALLIWSRPNLLLLDEPTNHLDLEMRHALTLSLQDYSGGVILVSHDRALLRATCDQFLLLNDGRAQIYAGDLDDYANGLATTPNQTDAETPPAKANAYALQKAARQALLEQRRPLIKEAEQLEQALSRWQTQKTACDARLNDAALYTAADKTELQQLLKQQATLIRQIEEAEERWLTVQSALEALAEAH